MIDLNKYTMLFSKIRQRKIIFVYQVLVAKFFFQKKMTYSIYSKRLNDNTLRNSFLRSV